MAKILWIITVAACLCHVNATDVLEEAKAHGAEVVKAVAGGHAVKEEEETGSIPAVILLSGVGFMFAIFYMVNSTMEEVRTQTWSAVSAGVSIFVAVMFNTMVHKLTCGEEEEGHEEEATTHQALKLALKMFLTTVLVCLLLFLQRANKLRLYAYGVIGGHILGFGAIDLFAVVANLEAFNTNPWRTLLVFLIYIFAVQVLVYPLKKMFHILGHFCSGDDANAAQLDAAKEQAEDTSTDFFCMGASFLLAMFFRGIISGKVVEEEAESSKHTWQNVTYLALAGILFMGLSGVIRTVIHKLAQTNEDFKQGHAGKLLNVLGTTSSLACAWCFLNSSQWNVLVRFPHDHMIGNVVVALEASLVFILAVYILAQVIKHVGADVKQTLKGEFTAVGLYLGLSWEHVFDVALEGIEPSFPEPHRGLQLGVFTLVLVLFVFPAWVVYIVPKHDESLTVAGPDGISPLTAFCDCEGGEDESEDEEPVE